MKDGALNRDRTVCLVMCSGQKAIGPTFARDLYVSARFQSDRAHAERSFDRWYILSGKHGLLSCESIVEPYDFDLSQQTPEYRIQWGRKVARAIALELSAFQSVIEIRANRDYQTALVPFLIAEGFCECGAPPKARHKFGVLRMFRGISVADANPTL